jgi:hypothetical protein
LKQIGKKSNILACLSKEELLARTGIKNKISVNKITSQLMQEEI